MPYNLNEGQKDLLRWMVQENRAGKLSEEHWVYWVSETPEGTLIERQGEHPPVTQGALDALSASGLVCPVCASAWCVRARSGSSLDGIQA